MSTVNFQKCSETGVFCTFWLPNVLRATTACTLSSQLPKMLRSWCALHTLTSKCASRHKGVQFFISHLPRLLRTRRFSEPTFRPSGAPNHWNKNSVSRLCYLFAHLHLLSSGSFLWLFPLTLSSESFSSLIFSPLLSSALLCSALLFSSPLLSSLLLSSLLFSSLLWLFPPLLFPSYHIIGSLTSKLPSIIYLQYIIIIIIILFWHIVTLWKSLQSHCKPARRFKKATPLSSPCAPGRFCCRPWVVGRDWRLVKPRWMNWTGLATCA